MDYSCSPPILYIYINMYIFSWQINSAAAVCDMATLNYKNDS